MYFPGAILSSRRLSALSLSLLSAFSAKLLAQEDELYFSKLPVVASVSRLAQPLSEAPGAVTVIDSEIIRASGARSLSDLMRLVPGFSVAPASQKPAVVAYHGLSNEEYTPRVQVLIDGRSQYSPLFQSGVNWNLLPVALEDIERIEVMRGSNTVSYGSNALMGVINIITQHPSVTRGWMVSANHGNQSIDDTTLRWGGRAGDSDIRFTYRQQNDGGLRRMTNDINSGVWYDPHDSSHGQMFDFRVDTTLNERDELSVALSHMENVSQFGKPANTTDPLRDRAQNSTSLGAEWKRVFSADEDLRLRYLHVEDWSSDHFYYSRTGFTYSTPTNPNPPSPITFNAMVRNGGNSVRDEIELQHTLSPFSKSRLNWGLGWQRSTVSSYEQFSTDAWQQRSTVRAFGNWEWRPFKSWLFNAGASVERDSIFGYAFDPRVSASYHLTPDHTLRFVASRAHRTPSLYEARGNTTLTQLDNAAGQTPLIDRTFYADSGLKPEEIRTVELGYLGEFKPIRASVDVRFFNEHSPNRILNLPTRLPASAGDNGETRDQQRYNILNSAVYPDGRADSARDLEHVSIRGYEQQWRWQPFEGTRIIYSHAYTSIYASMDESQIADDGRLAGDTGNTRKIGMQTRTSAPRHSTSAMLIQQLPYNLEASLQYFKQSEMRWRRSPNTMIRPFEEIDWRLAWRFKSGSARGEIAYVAQAANTPHDAIMNTRTVNETHWLTLRLEY